MRLPKKFIEERGSIKIFRRKFSVSVPKISVGESFTVALFLCVEKVRIRAGEHQDFLPKVFCLSLPKISVGESFTVALILFNGKIWIRVGEYQEFLLKVFCLSLAKYSVGESFTVALIPVPKKFG